MHMYNMHMHMYMSCACAHVTLFSLRAAFSLVVLVGIQQHVLAGAVAKAQAVLLEQLDVPAGAPSTYRHACMDTHT